MGERGGQTEGCAPSPLTGAYLLIVLPQPHLPEHKDAVLHSITKGFLSWDKEDCHVDLEKELQIITAQAPEGEEARNGERLIQFASENLVTEVLIHPQLNTVVQCIRNLLSSFTRHRHIIHAGYTYVGNGSWILQDGTFSFADFVDMFQEVEVQRVLRAYENTVTIDVHCGAEGGWTLLKNAPQNFSKLCRVRLSPDDKLTSGPSIHQFLDYLSPYLLPASLEDLLQPSDVVGNIRFSHPTLYVFPGGQGDAALFGINGFNMLVDGGFSRKACFWDFIRHLDRLDAVLMTRLNNGNLQGISSLLYRKRLAAVYPQIGHFFCNLQERRQPPSPDGDKDKDPLTLNLIDQGQEIVSSLRQLNLKPQACYRELSLEPINLYHKVGHGKLDMYVLCPAKDSREVKEFLTRWNASDAKLFASQSKKPDIHFPLYNRTSICALLVWQPANPNDNITRLLFPGSAPQDKIFEGLDRLKNLDFMRHAVCSAKSLSPSSSTVGLNMRHPQISGRPKGPSVIEKLPPSEIRQMSKPIESYKPPAKLEPQEPKPQKPSKQPKPAKVPKEKTEPDNIAIQDKQKSQEPPQKKTEKPKGDKPKKIVQRHEKKAQQQKPSEKKADSIKSSPTTPKKTAINGETKHARASSRTRISPSATPAKSAKEENNRKVVESKAKETAKRTVPAKKEDAKKIEKRTVSKRPHQTTSPSKVIGKPSSPIKTAALSRKKDVARKVSKTEKELATDSSTVSTPSTVDAELGAAVKQREVLEKEKTLLLDDAKKEKIASEKGGDDETAHEEVALLSKEEEDEILIIEKVEIDEEEGGRDQIEMHIVTEESIPKSDIKGEAVEEPVEEEKLIDSVEKEEKSKEIVTSESEQVQAKLQDEQRPAMGAKERPPLREKSQELLDQKIDESQPDERFSTTIESGATTAPTLPEDERIPLDEIKEGIEEKYVKEKTKEKEEEHPQKPEQPTSLPQVAVIPGTVFDQKTQLLRDIVKTPDEVADLPVHEEADAGIYERGSKEDLLTLPPLSRRHEETPREEALEAVEATEELKFIKDGLEKEDTNKDLKEDLDEARQQARIEIPQKKDSKTPVKIEKLDSKEELRGLETELSKQVVKEFEAAEIKELDEKMEKEEGILKQDESKIKLIEAREEREGDLDRGQEKEDMKIDKPIITAETPKITQESTGLLEKPEKKLTEKADTKAPTEVAGPSDKKDDTFESDVKEDGLKEESIEIESTKKEELIDRIGVVTDGLEKDLGIMTEVEVKDIISTGVSETKELTKSEEKDGKVPDELVSTLPMKEAAVGVENISSELEIKPDEMDTIDGEKAKQDVLPKELEPDSKPKDDIVKLGENEVSLPRGEDSIEPKDSELFPKEISLKDVLEPPIEEPVKTDKEKTNGKTEELTEPVFETHKEEEKVGEFKLEESQDVLVAKGIEAKEALILEEVYDVLEEHIKDEPATIHDSKREETEAVTGQREDDNVDKTKPELKVDTEEITAESTHGDVKDPEKGSIETFATDRGESPIKAYETVLEKSDEPSKGQKDPEKDISDTVVKPPEPNDLVVEAKEKDTALILDSVQKEEPGIKLWEEGIDRKEVDKIRDVTREMEKLDSDMALLREQFKLEETREAIFTPHVETEGKDANVDTKKIDAVIILPDDMEDKKDSFDQTGAVQSIDKVTEMEMKHLPEVDGAKETCDITSDIEHLKEFDKTDKVLKEKELEKKPIEESSKEISAKEQNTFDEKYVVELPTSTAEFQTRDILSKSEKFEETIIVHGSDIKTNISAKSAEIVKDLLDEEKGVTEIKIESAVSSVSGTVTETKETFKDKVKEIKQEETSEEWEEFKQEIIPLEEVTPIPSFEEISRHVKIDSSTKEEEPKQNISEGLAEVDISDSTKADGKSKLHISEEEILVSAKDLKKEELTEPTLEIDLKITGEKKAEKEISPAERELIKAVAAEELEKVFTIAEAVKKRDSMPTEEVEKAEIEKSEKEPVISQNMPGKEEKKDEAEVPKEVKIQSEEKSPVEVVKAAEVKPDLKIIDHVSEIIMESDDVLLPKATVEEYKKAEEKHGIVFIDAQPKDESIGVMSKSESKLADSTIKVEETHQKKDEPSQADSVESVAGSEDSSETKAKEEKLKGSPDILDEKLDKDLLESIDSAKPGETFPAEEKEPVICKYEPPEITPGTKKGDGAEDRSEKIQGEDLTAKVEASLEHKEPKEVIISTPTALEKKIGTTSKSLEEILTAELDEPRKEGTPPTPTPSPEAEEIEGIKNEQEKLAGSKDECFKKENSPLATSPLPETVDEERKQSTPPPSNLLELKDIEVKEPGEKKEKTPQSSSPLPQESLKKDGEPIIKEGKGKPHVTPPPELDVIDSEITVSDDKPKDDVVKMDGSSSMVFTPPDVMSSDKSVKEAKSLIFVMEDTIGGVETLSRLSETNAVSEVEVGLKEDQTSASLLPASSEKDTLIKEETVKDILVEVKEKAHPAVDLKEVLSQPSLLSDEQSHDERIIDIPSAPQPEITKADIEAVDEKSGSLIPDHPVSVLKEESITTISPPVSDLKVLGDKDTNEKSLTSKEDKVASPLASSEQPESKVVGLKDSTSMDRPPMLMQQEELKNEMTPPASSPLPGEKITEYEELVKSVDKMMLETPPTSSPLPDVKDIREKEDEILISKEIEKNQEKSPVSSPLPDEKVQCSKDVQQEEVKDTIDNTESRPPTSSPLPGEPTKSTREEPHIKDSEVKRETPSPVTSPIPVEKITKDGDKTTVRLEEEGGVIKSTEDITQTSVMMTDESAEHRELSIPTDNELIVSPKEKLHMETKEKDDIGDSDSVKEGSDIEQVEEVYTIEDKAHTDEKDQVPTPAPIGYEERVHDHQKELKSDIESKYIIDTESREHSDLKKGLEHPAKEVKVKVVEETIKPLTNGHHLDSETILDKKQGESSVETLKDLSEEKDKKRPQSKDEDQGVEILPIESKSTVQEKDILQPETKDKVQEKDISAPETKDKMPETAILQNETIAKVQEKDISQAETKDKVKDKDILSAETKDNVHEKVIPKAETSDGMKLEEIVTSEAKDKDREKDVIPSETKDKVQEGDIQPANIEDKVAEKDILPAVTKDKIQERDIIPSETDDKVEGSNILTVEANDRVEQIHFLPEESTIGDSDRSKGEDILAATKGLEAIEKIIKSESKDKAPEKHDLLTETVEKEHIGKGLDTSQDGSSGKQEGKLIPIKAVSQDSGISQDEISIEDRFKEISTDEKGETLGGTIISKEGTDSKVVTTEKITTTYEEVYETEEPMGSKSIDGMKLSESVTKSVMVTDSKPHFENKIPIDDLKEINGTLGTDMESTFGKVDEQQNIMPSAEMKGDDAKGKEDTRYTPLSCSMTEDHIVTSDEYKEVDESSLSGKVEEQKVKIEAKAAKEQECPSIEKAAVQEVSTAVIIGDPNKSEISVHLGTPQKDVEPTRDSLSSIDGTGKIHVSHASAIDEESAKKEETHEATLKPLVEGVVEEPKSGKEEGERTAESKTIEATTSSITEDFISKKSEKSPTKTISPSKTSVVEEDGGTSMDSSMEKDPNSESILIVDEITVSKDDHTLLTEKKCETKIVTTKSLIVDEGEESITSSSKAREEPSMLLVDGKIKPQDDGRSSDKCETTVTTTITKTAILGEYEEPCTTTSKTIESAMTQSIIFEDEKIVPKDDDTKSSSSGMQSETIKSTVRTSVVGGLEDCDTRRDDLMTQPMFYEEDKTKSEYGSHSSADKGSKVITSTCDTKTPPALKSEEPSTKGSKTIEDTMAQSMFLEDNQLISTVQHDKDMAADKKFETTVTVLTTSVFGESGGPSTVSSESKGDSMLQSMFFDENETMDKVKQCLPEEPGKEVTEKQEDSKKAEAPTSSKTGGDKVAVDSKSKSSVGDVGCSEEGMAVSSVVAELRREHTSRSTTPAGSDAALSEREYEPGQWTPHSDTSSGQVSRAATHMWESSQRYGDESDEETPGSPMSTTSHLHSPPRFDYPKDSMTGSFYGTLPEEDPKTKVASVLSSMYVTRYEDKSEKDSSSSSVAEVLPKTLEKDVDLPKMDVDFRTALEEHKAARGDDSTKKDPLEAWGKPLGLPPVPRTATSRSSWDALGEWGHPLNLPSPAPPPTAKEESNGDIEVDLVPTSAKTTPKKIAKMNAENNKIASNTIAGREALNNKSKRSDSPVKRTSNKDQMRKSNITPVYMDLSYVPHQGNSHYANVEFFKRVRARYYVFSGTEPSREVFNALLEAKQTWEDKDLEVTIIPTYDTDTLGYWIAENEDALAKYKIDLSPSASRCTINLQDHETSCSAYRLEF